MYIHTTLRPRVPSRITEIPTRRLTPSPNKRHERAHVESPSQNQIALSSVFDPQTRLYGDLKRLRSINMKLNPKKCSFDVEDGPFLGHLITKHGIKANPSKVKAVTDLDQPRTLKDDKVSTGS
ncbi:reverse transcriptase domain-containing protein [Tanacetum coccineum]